MVANLERPQLQFAIRTSLGTVFGVARVPVEFATVEGVDLGQDKFREMSARFAAGQPIRVEDVRIADDAKLRDRNICVVGRAEGKVYVAFQLPLNVFCIAELAQVGRDLVVVVKAQEQVYLAVVQPSVQALFGHK
jgi:hypothetical protein